MLLKNGAQLRNSTRRESFYYFCRPNKQHMDALNSLLLTVERERGLSQADMQARLAVAQQVQTLLQPHIPGRFLLYKQSFTFLVSLAMVVGSDHPTGAFPRYVPALQSFCF